MTNQKRSNPYVGPRRFNKDESHLFFGREREARDLLALVVTERLVLFYAQSGAGKSSLVSTRLITGLEEKGFEVLPVGRVSGQFASEIKVSNPYLVNLMLSLDESGIDTSILADLSLPAFLDGFTRGDDGKYTFDDSLVGEGITYDNPAAKTSSESGIVGVWPRALIIDQFEELLSTQPESWEERGTFFKELSEAMQEDPYLWVVLVMREDYIAALDPFAHLLPGKLRARYYMQQLGKDAALEAVEKPAEKICPYAPGVAKYLVDDLREIKVMLPDGRTEDIQGEYIEPVQLQVVCYRLWENLDPSSKEISQQDLVAVGNVDQSLAVFYADKVKSISQQTATYELHIRKWFEEKLITEGGLRSAVMMQVEESGGIENKVIRMLQKAHLVRAEKRSGTTWFELAHDRLVEPILKDNAVWFDKNLSLLQRQAPLWDGKRRPEGMLLQGEALADAEKWAAQHENEMTDLDKEYLEACERLRRRQEEAQKYAERLKKNNRVITVVAVVALAFLLVAVFAFIFANQKSKEAITAQHEMGTAAIKKEQAYSTAESDRSTALADRSTAQAASTQAVAHRKTAEANASRAQAAEMDVAAQLAKNWLVQGETVFQEQPLLGLRMLLEALAIAPEERVDLQTNIVNQVKEMAGQGRLFLLGKQIDKVYQIGDGPLLVLDIDDGPGEIRRSSDAVLEDTLSGEVFSISFPNEAYFTIDYGYGTPEEIRLTENGELVYKGQESSYGFTLSENPKTNYFVEEYSKKDELRRLDDGEIVKILPDGVYKIFTSPDEEASYLVITNFYHPAGVFRMSDVVQVGKLLSKGASITVFSNPKSDCFYVDYYSDRNLPDELRRFSDGSIVPLNGVIEFMSTSPDPQEKYIVLYYTNRRAELRSSIDCLPVELSGELSWHQFSSDTEGKFMYLEYADQHGELRRTGDGSLVLEMPGEISHFKMSPNEDVSYFLVSYSDGPAELHSTEEGARIAMLSDEVIYSTFSKDEQASYLIVDYKNAPPELRRSSDGALITKLSVYDNTGPEDKSGEDQEERSSEPDKTSSLTYLLFSSDDEARYFVVEYQDEFSELRRSEDGSIVQEYKGDVYSIRFSPDPALSTFVITYSDSSAELRRTSDGFLIDTYTQAGSFDLEPEPLFFVSITDQEQYELRLFSDGSYLDTYEIENKPQFYFMDPAHVIVFDQGRLASWSEKKPERPYLVIEEGIKDIIFYPDSGKMLIIYADGFAYMLDMVWLDQQAEIEERITASELEKLFCEYLDESEYYSEEMLDPHLGGQEPQACRD